MTHGQYAVQQGMDVEASKRTGRDNSYRACLHAMLIFIAICIILLVCAWPWNNHRASKGDKGSNSTGPSSAAVKGEEDVTTAVESIETTRATLSTARTTRGTTKYTRPTSTETTTFAVERKVLYKVIPVEESDNSTEPHEVPPRVEPTSTTEGSDVEASEGPVVEDPSIVGDTESAATTTEDATTTETTTTTEQPTTTEAVDSDVEVFTQAGGGSEHTQEHYESSTESGGETERVVSTDKSSTEATVSSTEATVSSTEAAVSSTEAAVSSTEATVSSTETTSVAQTTQINKTTKKTSIKGSNPVCETHQCKALATRMLTLMNHKVDPCYDFYEHACGGLRLNPTLLGDDPNKDVYDRIRRGMDAIVDGNSCQAHRKFKKYYKSCVEFDAISKEKRISEARRILDKIGHFNDVEIADEHVSVDSFTSLISKLMSYHSTPLFDLMLDVDGKNPSHFALKLTAPVFKPALRPFDKREDCLKPSLINDLNQYYKEYTRCKKNEHNVYLQELQDALEALDITKSTKTITDIKQNVEWHLLSATDYLPEAGVVQQQLTGKEYELMTIRELNQLFPQVEWGVLVESLLKRSLPDDTEVQVYFKDYLEKMFDDFKSLLPRKQQNALLAWFAHDLYVDLVLTKDSCSRDSYCLRVASDLMEDVSSSLYLTTFKQGVLRNLRTEAQLVFSQLRNTLEVQLRDADWLDDASRSSAVSKLKALTLEVNGGVNVYLNETFLDERMQMVELQDTNYVTLSASLLRRYRQQMYALYNVNPSEAKAIWSHFLLPYSTQGIVIYALKKVVIPYGLMTKPMYEPSLPRYLLMARLGFVIAHEMAHHFDVNGITYGPNGKDDYLLSQAASPAFTDTLNCPKDLNSFQGYRTADDGRSIKFKGNESLSLNERLADRTAAALSYDAYVSWVTDTEQLQLPYLGLSNDQVYFLAVAQIFCSKSTILDYGVSLFEDEHPPPFLRVNTIVDNSFKFPEVFGCKLGVPMNPSPDVKCEAFPKLTAVEDDRYSTPNE